MKKIDGKKMIFCNKMEIKKDDFYVLAGQQYKSDFYFFFNLRNLVLTLCKPVSLTWFNLCAQFQRTV